MLTRSKDSYGAPDYYYDSQNNGRPVRLVIHDTGID